jgi:hypothetical protein
LFSVAKKVLEWGKHTLDGCPLTVSRPVQPKKKTTPSREEDEDSDQPVQRSRVVRVSGISEKTTKDALLNFFENTRRSGGGEIEDIQRIPEERMADIIFFSPEGIYEPFFKHVFHTLFGFALYTPRKLNTRLAPCLAR